MSSISLRLATSSFPDNYGYVDMPNKPACAAYHLFGPDQASSVYNRVNPAAPLLVNGSPSYEANDFLCIGNTGIGFSTPFTTSAFNRVSITIATDDYESIATPSVPTQAAFDGGVEYMSWNSASQWARYVGSSMFWRQGAQDLTAASSNFAPAHWFFPDGTQRISKYRTLILMEDPVNLTMWFQNGTVVQETTIPVGGSPPTIPDSPTRIGFGGNSANTRWRLAAFAQFNSSLTISQALASATYMQADVTARGIDFVTPVPMLPV